MDFVRREPDTVVLLSGGDERWQEADIRAAILMAREP